jgi:hypothetical protein
MNNIRHEICDYFDSCCFCQIYNDFNLNLPRLKFEIKIQNNLTKSSKNKLTSINSHELYTLRLGSATVNEGLISVEI